MKRIFITLFAALTLVKTAAAQDITTTGELRDYACTLYGYDIFQKVGSTDFPLDSAGNIALEKEIPCPGKTAVELYVGVCTWTVRNFSGAESEITTNSSEKVAAKGFADITPDSSQLSSHSYSRIQIGKKRTIFRKENDKRGVSIRPEVTIEIKDGLLTIRQSVSEYEIWQESEKQVFNKTTKIKATRKPTIQMCYPYGHDEGREFFKSPYFAWNALVMTRAYEELLVKKLQDALGI